MDREKIRIKAQDKAMGLLEKIVESLQFFAIERDFDSLGPQVVNALGVAFLLQIIVCTDSSSHSVDDRIKEILEKIDKDNINPNEIAIMISGLQDLHRACALAECVME